MTMVAMTCEQCGRRFERRAAEIKYRAKHGIGGSFCSMKCSGKARRSGKTIAQRKREKAAYDAEYRERNRGLLKQNKREWHVRNYDPDEARRERRKKLRWHREYIKRYNDDPANKAHKADYDREHRASEFGPYAEAYKVLVALKKEILKQAPDKYERLKARGYYERSAQQRRRNEQFSRW